MTGYAESTTGTTKFHSGDATADGHGLQGMIDEVRVYNRALVEAEIAVLAGLQLADPRHLTLSIDVDSVWENGSPFTAIVTRR